MHGKDHWALHVHDHRHHDKQKTTAHADLFFVEGTTFDRHGSNTSHIHKINNGENGRQSSLHLGARSQRVEKFRVGSGGTRAFAAPHFDDDGDNDEQK